MTTQREIEMTHKYANEMAPVSTQLTKEQIKQTEQKVAEDARDTLQEISKYILENYDFSNEEDEDDAIKHLKLSKISNNLLLSATNKAATAVTSLASEVNEFVSLREMELTAVELESILKVAIRAAKQKMLLKEYGQFLLNRVVKKDEIKDAESALEDENGRQVLNLSVELNQVKYTNMQFKVKDSSIYDAVQEAIKQSLDVCFSLHFSSSKVQAS